MSRMSRDRQHRWGGHRMRPASCPVLSSPAAITTHRVPELNLLAASTGRAFLTLSAPCSDGGPPNALNAMQHPHLQLVGTSRPLPCFDDNSQHTVAARDLPSPGLLDVCSRLPFSVLPMLADIIAGRASPY
jgi:hypothetical protein